MVRNLALFCGGVLLCSSLRLVDSQSFRSILIERACAKRPNLDFCGESKSSTPSQPELPPSTTKTAPLILPPNPSADPKEIIVTTTTSQTTKALEPDTVDFEPAENSTAADNKKPSQSEAEEEQLGSLVRLAKPAKSTHEIVVDHVLKEGGQSPDADLEGATDGNGTSTSIEDEKGVFVFISEYCVIEREHFVRNCYGDIPTNEVDFCKRYISSCVSTNGVIPIISYCKRYYTHYPKNCKQQLVAQESLQFCFAFEQFCTPERSAAAQRPDQPKSSIKSCKDVADEARKVCNPFPDRKDRFNVTRCEHFILNCRKFVDWL